MWFWLCAAAVAEDHTWSEGVRVLELQNPVGDLHVEAGGDRIEVRLVPIENASCDISIDETEGRAVVKIRNRNRSGRGCRINVVVQLPSGSRADLALGAGDVHSVGVTGDVHLAVGAGNVHFEGGQGVVLDLGAGNVTGELQGDSRLTVGAGDCTLGGLTQPVSAQIGTGNLDLDYVRAPQGEISVTTGVGNVDIDLPDDTVVQAHGRANVFHLPTAPRAATIVEVTTGLGQASVH